MKKKGFVFIETIIVMVVLTIGMIVIYSSFSSVLNSSKRRVTYDDVAYIYRSYYIQEFLSSLNIDAYVKENLKNGIKVARFDCNAEYIYKLDNNTTQAGITETPKSQDMKKRFCQSMYNEFNVESIFITRYDVSDLKRCTTTSGKANCSRNTDENKNIMSGLDFLVGGSSSTGIIYYLRTLSVKTLSNYKGINEQYDALNDYRLIIVYNDKQYDQTSAVTKADGKCPTGYDDVNGTICKRVLSKTYYSNIKIITNNQLNN